MENFLLEFRASRASPLMTFPTFDGFEALAWLARANKYFLINKTPSDRRVDVAINAICGPAMPWLKLLLMRRSSLSWDKFTQELLRRFGDAAIDYVYITKYQPKHLPTSNDNTTVILPSLPTVTAPLLSSSPPTTGLQEIPPITMSTLHPDIDTKADNSSTPLPLVVQQPIHISVLVLPSPTPVVVTASLWSSSDDISQFQPPFFPLLRHTVPAAAAEQATLMYLFLLHFLKSRAEIKMVYLE